jgi:cysteinyl-tRNA synthetase
MYVCGITPYDSAHIGHARTYVSFDTLKRYLIKKGLEVYHIQNITDVDDKIINRCKETGADPRVLTEQTHSEALELLGRLNVLSATVYPKVSGHIAEIIELIKSLIGYGAAYETETGVYFSIDSFPQYGSLSGQNLEQIRAGARVEVDESKHDPADFALWKKTNNEILEFDSPWGRGRPGWHIECSAMAKRYAGPTLDIHGGARDLIFPHHDNEIAQSESANGTKFCNCWVHTGFLTVNGEKMSKSLGNFITIKQALSKFSPNAIRLFYLQAHYRSPLNYDEDNLEAMEESVERIFNSLGLIREAESNANSATHTDTEFRKTSNELIDLFYKNMENDLNTPEAIAVLFTLLRLTNSHITSEKKLDAGQLSKVKKSLEDMLWILGLVEQHAGELEDKFTVLVALLAEFGVDDASVTSAGDALERLIKMRDTVRLAKDYKKSDLIRNRLKEIGILVEDKAKPGEIRWKLITRK